MSGASSTDSEELYSQIEDLKLKIQQLERQSSYLQINNDTSPNEALLSEKHKLEKKFKYAQKENQQLKDDLMKQRQQVKLLKDTLKNPRGLEPIEIERPNGVGKVVMMTYRFGKAANEKRPFRLFLESMGTSGVDLVIVGDNPPSYHIPDNIRYYNISWDGFVDRVYREVFDNVPPTGKLRKAGVRKICDFKPLMAFLFPELIQGYDWWGTIDNDMLVGNFTKFLNEKQIWNYDIISGKKEHVAYGPFMLYRNIPAINELFKLVPVPPEDVFDDGGYHFFDEWRNNNKLLRNNSMHGILLNEAPKLGLRVERGIGNIYWDKDECPFKYGYDNIPEQCGECIYQHGKLYKGLDGMEVLYCHFHAAKKWLPPLGHHDESLNDDTKIENLVKLNEFRCTFLEGFDYLNTTESQKVKAAAELANRTKHEALLQRHA